MNCKICSSETRRIHGATVLNKHEVAYYKCKKCFFVQTDDPHWLQEAYTSAITQLDIGLLQRNLYLMERIPRIISILFPETKVFIDYGGGYGVFVRLMRDAGFNFFRYDIYCENLFSKHFDFVDAGLDKFDLLTSFEVFEHLRDPLKEIEQMFRMSDSIVFSTQLIPETDDQFRTWWYVAPQTGQHIAFYHGKTLQHIANQLGCYFYTNNNNLHILTKKKLKEASVEQAFGSDEAGFFEKLFVKKRNFSRSSLLQPDFEYIKGLIDIKK